MLHFEGDKDFPLPAADLYAKLSDARFLVGCIPGVEKVTRSDPGSAAFVLRPGFSFVRGTLEVSLEVADAVPGQSLRVVARSKGIGTSSRVDAALSFAGDGPGTSVHWAADVAELGGLLKAVPQGLLKASAQKVIADVWDSVAAKLGA